MTKENNKLEKLDGKSMDVVEHNIEQLKELFPEVFAEGKISFDKLQELLGNYLVEDEDHYNFTWHGKRAAGRLAQTPSTGTLRPCPKESVDWDKTQNLFIEGDNLEVLKLLQKSYHRQVKMIYIDPPYNTGNDFVYEDDFKDCVRNYLETTGQLDSEGKKKGTNSSSAGRYHTNWLNMMYPRLKLARNLLKDDGVIFISIDDNEQDNLKKLCNEVFGEENFIAQIVWQKSKKGDSKLIASVHEYILCFTKDKSAAIEYGIWRTKKNGVDEVLEKYQSLKEKYNTDHANLRESMMEWYRNLKDSDPRKNHKHYNWSDDRGLYFPDNFAGPDDGRESRPRHDIFHPATGKVCKKPSTGWRWDEKKTNWALEQQPPRIHFGVDETTIPNRKSYLKETALEPFNSHFYQDGRTATLQVENLLGKGIFQFPKNTNVLSKLISLITNNKDVVLDFFAGSGTTAHAVMKLNAEDGGNRRHISVQLPEIIEEKTEAYKAGYKNIADISKERIRRAAKKIKEENPLFAGDLGFKVFKLDTSNIKTWEAGFDTLEEDLLNAVDYIKNDRSSEDVLYELLLKYGLDLTVPIESRTIAGKTVYSIGLGALVVCLDKDISMDVVNGIGALKEELSPEIMRVVFKDEGFKDDVVKTNALQTLKRFGIEDIKSL